MDSAEKTTTQAAELIELSSDIVAAYVSHNPLAPSDLPKLLSEVHAALSALGSKPALVDPDPAEPAVPIRRSVTPDHLVCLEDGKTFTSLKRHLMTQHSLTPQQYRERWGLSADYPMVAPNYSAARSSLAISSGLGRTASPSQGKLTIAKRATKRPLNSAPTRRAKS